MGVVVPHQVSKQALLLVEALGPCSRQGDSFQRNGKHRGTRWRLGMLGLGRAQITPRPSIHCSLVLLICSSHTPHPRSQVPSCHTQADSQQWQEEPRSLVSTHGASALLSSGWDSSSRGLGDGVGWAEVSCVNLHSHPSPPCQL